MRNVRRSYRTVISVPFEVDVSTTSLPVPPVTESPIASPSARVIAAKTEPAIAKTQSPADQAALRQGLRAFHS